MNSNHQPQPLSQTSQTAESFNSTSSNSRVTITRHDVQSTLNANAELLKSSTKYYRKIVELSQAASEFANLLELTGKCKGAEQSGVGLKAAAELHRVIGKNQELLAESIHKDFELPLQRNVLAHQKRVEENEKSYEKIVRKIQDEISKTEGKMLKGRKKDLSAFQQSLQDMQKQAQELERTKQENIDRMLADEEKNFMFLVQKAAGLVKSQYEHFSSLSILSREATEEIISIAFAPPGKSLDAAEKKRVVDKFLGSGAGTATSVIEATAISHRSSMNSVVEEGRRASLNSVVSAAGNNQNVPTQRPPAPPLNLSNSAAAATLSSANGRPLTPPISPLPQQSFPFSSASNITATANSTRRSSNSTIQESLNRLNIAESVISTNDQQHLNAVKEEESSEEYENINNLNKKHLEDLKSQQTIQKPSTISTAIPSNNSEVDLVIGLHDFNARSERELSFKKNDVLLVKQRQENWLYATQYGSSTSKSGWIPVSYTLTFNSSNKK